MPLISKLVKLGVVFGGLLLAPSVSAFALDQPDSIVWVNQPEPGWEGRYDAQCTEYNTPLSPQIRKTVIVHGGIGNANAQTRFSDLWISTDHGTTWKKQNVNPNYPAPQRFGAGFALLANKNLIMWGGAEGNAQSPNNDVWWSNNQGIKWNKQKQAPWGPRLFMTALVIPSSNIAVSIAGFNSEYGCTNEVWLTFDGKGELWSQRTPLPWVARARIGGTVTGDIAIGSTIVLAGGSDGGGVTYNDVLYSKDLATTWVTANPAPFSNRGAPNLISYGDVVYMFNGFDYNLDLTPTDGHWEPAAENAIRLYNDTWRSADFGMTWEENPPNVNMKARYAACASMTMPGQVVQYGGTHFEDYGMTDVQIANFYNGTAESALADWSGLAQAITKALKWATKALMSYNGAGNGNGNSH